jgi:hypothetical protein
MRRSKLPVALFHLGDRCISFGRSTLAGKSDPAYGARQMEFGRYGATAARSYSAQVVGDIGRRTGRFGA